MERNVREFLREIGAEGLKDRGVLSPNRRYFYLLQGANVAPLLALMRERGVSKLVSHDGKWFLTAEGEFANPKSREGKTGLVKQLEKCGNVFWGQNPVINPYFEPNFTDLKTRKVGGFTRITCNPEVMSGKPCIRGMRVTVGMIVGMIAAGHSPEKLLTLYPYLEAEDIQESLAYAAWQDSEIEASFANTSS